MRQAVEKLSEHPYGKYCYRGSDVFDLAARLASPVQDCPHSIAKRVKDVLRSSGYSGFYQHVIERPVGCEIGGVSCTYLYNRDALVMVEEVVLPGEQDLHARLLSDDGVDFAFIHFHSTGAGIRHCIAGFAGIDRETEDYLMERVWAWFRLSQQDEVRYLRPGELSAQRLLRAVNYARGVR